MNILDEDDDSLAQGLIIAILTGKEGASEEHMTRIHEAFLNDHLAYNLWNLVFSGELAVSWDEESQELAFSKVPDDEVPGRRADIERAMLLERKV